MLAYTPLPMDASALKGLYMAVVVVACLVVMLAAQCLHVSPWPVHAACFAFMVGVALGLGVAPTPGPDAKTPVLIP